MTGVTEGELKTIRDCNVRALRKLRDRVKGTVRRLAIFALALSMAGLGPVPLSACAIVSSRMAECATLERQSECNQMSTHEGIMNGAGTPNGSCCSLSADPVPATRHKPFEASLADDAALFVEVTRELPNRREQRPVQIEHTLSPPPLQSLLCIFLI